MTERTYHEEFICRACNKKRPVEEVIPGSKTGMCKACELLADLQMEVLALHDSISLHNGSINALLIQAIHGALTQIQNWKHYDDLGKKYVEKKPVKI
jgi:hypothetical protein